VNIGLKSLWVKHLAKNFSDTLFRLKGYHRNLAIDKFRACIYKQSLLNIELVKPIRVCLNFVFLTERIRFS